MPRLPDLSGYTFDQLQTLIFAVNKKVDDIRGKRVKELQAELGELGFEGSAPASRTGRKRSQGFRASTGQKRASHRSKSVPGSFEGRMERSTQGEVQSLRGPGARCYRSSRPRCRFQGRCP